MSIFQFKMSNHINLLFFWCKIMSIIVKNLLSLLKLRGMSHLSRSEQYEIYHIYREANICIKSVQLKFSSYPLQGTYLIRYSSFFLSFFLKNNK